MKIDSQEILKQKIKKKLSRIPGNKLKEVDDFIDFLLHKLHIEEGKPVRLKGIWENTGLEKIIDIENELVKVRKELSDSILKREIT